MSAAAACWAVLSTAMIFALAVDYTVFLLASVKEHHEREGYPQRAQHVRVEIGDRGGMIESEIADDGRGFDLEHVLARPGAALHAGLGTLTERVRAAGERSISSRNPGTAPDCGSRSP